jgi:hypothetical protein
MMLAKAGAGIQFNGDSPTVFVHACKMGLEGIVSKRKDSVYRSGRSPDWLKNEERERAGRGARRGGIKPAVIRHVQERMPYGIVCRTFREEPLARPE